jgi:hypothetical protein
MVLAENTYSAHSAIVFSTNQKDYELINHKFLIGYRPFDGRPKKHRTAV